MKKKGVAILFIALVMFSFSGNIFGAINTTYQNGQTVVEDDLETKSGDSVILNVIAPFVYWIASTVENLVGKAFKGLTGSEMFPWADRVLFNTLPMLDINIFNPAQNSLFKTGDGKVTPLAKIVRNTYFTVLSISVAFLTVVVGIAAAKLALSSIASEKAKYKEAVTKWLFSIILIFLMHNVMSFIFWVNEQMVVIASEMVDKAILEGNLSLLQSALELEDEEMVKLFTDANRSNISWLTDDEVNFVKENANLGAKFLGNDKYLNSILFDALGQPSGWKEYWNGNGKQSLRALIKDMKIVMGEKNSDYAPRGNEIEISIDDFIKFKKEIDSGFSFEYDDTEKGEKFEKTYFGTIGNGEMPNPFPKDEDGSSEALDAVRSFSLESRKIVYYFYKQIQPFLGGDKDQYSKKYLIDYVNAMVQIYNSYSKSSSNSNDSSNTSVENGSDVIAGLGNYFKKAAYTLPTDEAGKAVSWKRSKLTITGAILYAIFVFQSIFYFLAYLKRFFYIVILVIMAPVIVLLDFLRKALV